MVCLTATLLAGELKVCTDGCMMLRKVAAWLPHLVIDVVIKGLPVALIQLL
jgi:hypothetical protein